MKTIAVGMSGGIDSTITAMLLKAEGHQVIGLTMAIWDDSIPLEKSTKSGCFGPGEAEDLEAAKAACAKLGIAHHVIYLKDEFKQNVLSYFCSTYNSGKTPNPCLMCNSRMKFGFLPLRAREQGIAFDLFATGHYVRSRFDETTGRYQLLRALDHSKDQSYFLSYLDQSQLSGVVFPLGEYTKAQIRELATRMGFPELVSKQESQDFFEADDYSLLFEPDSFAAGDIVDISGKVIGKHRGLIHYTIGQRKNLGIAGQSEPYYVLKIDAINNKVVVGPKPHLYHSSLVAEKVNWIAFSQPQLPVLAQAKIRLQHDPAPCEIEEGEDGTLIVKFSEPQLSITPGQAIVFYDGDLVLGGGIIR